MGARSDAAPPAGPYLGLLLILIVALGAWLRLANLGYSEFQGDEAIAMTQPLPGDSFIDFLLAQRKGPIQFLITHVLAQVDPSHSHAVFWRLPFALAGIASIWVIYRLASLYFGKIAGLYAGILLATNGLFVAFSRIVQFQSIVVLGTLLTLYWLSLALRHGPRGATWLYLAAIAASITCLAHFDGSAVVPPAIFLLVLWYRRNAAIVSTRKARWHVAVTAALFLVPLLAFYVPFAFLIQPDTTNYWIDRWLGRPSVSTTVFSYYNGQIATFVYLSLAVVGALSLWRRSRETQIFMLLWIVPPLIVTEPFMSAPRTHISTYILPGIILVAQGFDIAASAIARGWNRITGSDLRAPFSHLAGILVIVVFAGISHTLLVDHRPEYPWEPKRFLAMNFPSKVMAGVMGFPYRRGWERAAAYLDRHAEPGTQYYVTNERAALAEFYLPSRFVNADLADGVLTPDLKQRDIVYVLQVERPQSWRATPFNLKPETWSKVATPIRTFEDKSGRAAIKLFRAPSAAPLFRQRIYGARD